jgi:heme oxygenase
MTALKDGTADLHAEAETHVHILDSDADEAAYAQYLARMYGFHAPIEVAFARHAGLEAAGFAAVQRAKRSMLAADLAELLIDARTLPACDELPELGDVMRATGVAYVIEGSTLGGKFILSRMRPHLPTVMNRATRFLAGYGEQTGARWRQFCALGERVLFDDGAIDAALNGARDTFRSLITWLGGRP